MLNIKERAEFENYSKVKKLGEGSFGVAYLVKRQSDGLQCVMKMIDIHRMKEQEKREVVQEAKLLEALTHPNICAFIEVYKTKKGKLCIVMDFADAGDLQQRIKEQRGRAISEGQILDWFTQICLGMKHIHDRKVIHRDLKGQNVFLTKKGIVKIGDFGIAKVLQATMQKAKTVVGTPYYLSPEVVQAQPYSFSTDVWSMGVMLYEMAALKPPFDAPSLHILSMRIVRGAYSPIPNSYSQQLKNLVSQCLAVQPTRRPTVNAILKMPIIQDRIKTYLSTSVIQNEFSHTILHKENVFSAHKKLQQQEAAQAKPSPTPTPEPSRANAQGHYNKVKPQYQENAGVAGNVNSYMPQPQRPRAQQPQTAEQRYREQQRAAGANNGIVSREQQAQRYANAQAYIANKGRGAAGVSPGMQAAVGGYNQPQSAQPRGAGAAAGGAAKPNYHYQQQQQQKEQQKQMEERKQRERARAAAQYAQEKKDPTYVQIAKGADPDRRGRDDKNVRELVKLENRAIERDEELRKHKMKIDEYERKIKDKEDQLKRQNKAEAAYREKQRQEADLAAVVAQRQKQNAVFDKKREEENRNQELDAIRKQAFLDRQAIAAKNAKREGADRKRGQQEQEAVQRRRDAEEESAEAAYYEKKQQEADRAAVQAKRNKANAVVDKKREEEKRNKELDAIRKQAYLDRQAIAAKNAKREDADRKRGQKDQEAVQRRRDAEEESRKRQEEHMKMKEAKDDMKRAEEDRRKKELEEQRQKWKADQLAEREADNRKKEEKKRKAQMELEKIRQEKLARQQQDQKRKDSLMMGDFSSAPSKAKEVVQSKQPKEQNMTTIQRVIGEANANVMGIIDKMEQQDVAYKQKPSPARQKRVSPPRQQREVVQPQERKVQKSAAPPQTQNNWYSQPKQDLLERAEDDQKFAAAAKAKLEREQDRAKMRADMKARAKQNKGNAGIELVGFEDSFDPKKNKPAPAKKAAPKKKEDAAQKAKVSASEPKRSNEPANKRPQTAVNSSEPKVQRKAWGDVDQVPSSAQKEKQDTSGEILDLNDDRDDDFDTEGDDDQSDDLAPARDQETNHLIQQELRRQELDETALINQELAMSGEVLSERGKPDSNADEDEIDQYVGDQAYQMYQELLGLVRADSSPADAENETEATTEAEDEEVKEVERPVKKKYSSPNEKPMYSPKMSIVKESEASEEESFKNKKEHLDKQFDEIINKATVENRDDFDDDSESDSDNDLEERDVSAGQRNKMADFTFMGGEELQSDLASKMDSIENIREYLEIELGESVLLKAYPILKDIGESILFTENQESVVQKLSHLMSREKVLKYQTFFAMLVFFELQSEENGGGPKGLLAADASIRGISATACFGKFN